ncbi:MAG TPA: hypothetical protein VNB23_00750, partial [Ramlibacter sp.]|nr:hypothetical protein [Ramlibacter sp.]
MDYEFLDDGIFGLRGFLSAEECAYHIRQSEHLGYADATIETGRGAMLRKDVRNNERILLDDQALSARFFKRVQDYLLPVLRDRSLCGFNERWRFYRYTAGQQFDWHLDGVVRL